MKKLLMIIIASVLCALLAISGAFLFHATGETGKTPALFSHNEITPFVQYK